MLQLLCIHAAPLRLGPMYVATSGNPHLNIFGIAMYQCIYTGGYHI